MTRILFRLGLLLPLVVGCAKRDVDVGDFKTFSSPAGRFTAEFPGDPTASDQVVNTAIGPMTIYALLLQTGTTEYSAGYNDLPATLSEAQVKTFDANKALASVRDGVAGATKSRVTKETTIALGKWPGREWDLEAMGDAQEDFRWRCFIVKTRQYQIGIGWLKGKRPAEEVIDAFLNSLKLTAE